MADGFIGMFQVPEPGAIIPKCNDISGMTFQVSETAIESNNMISANALLEVGNVDIADGKISTVIAEQYIDTTGDGAADTWVKVNTYAVEWAGNDNTGEFTLQNIPWDETGIAHDFRVYFQNGDGELAIQTSDSKQIGVATPTGAGWLEDLTVTFNGVTDLTEYAEVLDLEASNAADVEGGGSGNPAVAIPTNGIIRLEWKDMSRSIGINTHPMGDGTTANISKLQWRKLRGYVVYMYIKNTGYPQYEYPDATDSNGDWYFVGETLNTYLEVDCPKDKEVAFWVGVKVQTTPSAHMIPVPKLTYTEY